MNTIPTNAKESTSDVARALDRIGLTRAHKVILLVVMLGGFFDVFEQNGASVTGPALREAWGISATDVSLIAFTTFISMVVGGLVTGVLADRAGRKTLFAFNLAIYSVGGLLCALSPDFGWLLVGRVIVGLALGGELTIALPYLSELMPTKFRGTAVSLFNFGAGGLGNPISFLFGALILGVLGPALSHLGGAWRWYFGLLALPALLVLYIRRNLPETPRFLVSRGRIDDANEALARLDSGTLKTVPASRVTEYLPADTDTIALNDRRHSLWSDIRLLFTGRYLRNTLTVGIASFVSFGAHVGVLTMVPLILVDRGFDIGSSLGFTAAMQGGALAGALASAWTSRRFPRRLVMPVAGTLAGVFGLLFGVLGTTVPLIIGFGILFNFFVMISNTTIWAWAPELFPTRVRATGTGVIVNMGMLGQAILPVIAAGVFTSFGVAPMFILIASAFALLVVLSLLAPETQGRSLEEMHGE
ncbi:MFS transporter [Microbacterium sp.]|uniref:MFS transporter n=1 Tax=Microbacterium sp. TaxID=51671 RepID=UPI001ACD66FB|nr:MFS transporter [Microbacterium sp.]MBN9159063.1 MFS transporter [Microbacterium sp.]